MGANYVTWGANELTELSRGAHSRVRSSQAMKRCFALLLLAGCASTASLTPAVRVDDAGVQKTLFVKLPDRIFSMSPLPDGTHELITAGGRRVVDATGAVIGSSDMTAKSIDRAFVQSRGEFAVGNVLGDARAEAVAGDGRA